MRRPTAITLISLFLFAWAGLMGAGALSLFLLDIDLSELPEIKATGVDPGLLPVILTVAGALAAVISAVAIALGLGLWHLKNWARITTIAIGGIWAAFRAIEVLVLAFRAEDLMLAWGLVKLGLNFLVVWYLVQPNVKLAFATLPPSPIQAHSAPPPPPPPSPKDPSEQP